MHHQQPGPNPSFVRPRPPVRHTAPPPPQSQPTATGGGGGEIPQFVNDAISMGISNQFARQAIISTVGENMKHISWFSWDFFRYYFKVNNKYVLTKLKLICFPYLQDSWARSEVAASEFGQNAKVVYKPPVQDYNAPDLYIPMMAFITYILLMGYILGKSGSFHPDVLGLTATGAIVVLFLENLCLNLSYYLLSVSNSPPILDTIAYTWYKFVPVNIGLLIWIFFGDFAYYVVSALLGISYGMFLVSAEFLFKTLILFCFLARQEL
jgi:hypothetical protein